MADRRGYVANQTRKVVYMAEFMHEMQFELDEMWDAPEQTKKLVSAAAAVRMGSKTGQPKIDADKLSLRGVRLPSAETWAMACTHLQHMYDQDAIPTRDLFASVYAVEPR
jgi:hypothetical protein